MLYFRRFLLMSIKCEEKIKRKTLLYCFEKNKEKKELLQQKKKLSW